MVRKTLALAALLLVSACGKPKLVAPKDHGVCYYIAQTADGKIRNNPVARNIPNIEQCAAELERMRIRFLRMGGSHDEIYGAYQGTFIYLQRNGIFTGANAGGMRYLLLVRLNGKLVAPGAVVEAPEAPQVPAAK